MISRSSSSSSYLTNFSRLLFSVVILVLLFFSYLSALLLLNSSYCSSNPSSFFLSSLSSGSSSSYLTNFSRLLSSGEIYLFKILFLSAVSFYSYGSSNPFSPILHFFYLLLFRVHILPIFLVFYPLLKSTCMLSSFIQACLLCFLRDGRKFAHPLTSPKQYNTFLRFRLLIRAWRMDRDKIEVSVGFCFIFVFSLCLESEAERK